MNFNLRDGKLHNYIAFDHTDNLAFGRPILVNEMFEHAYHMDFGSNAGMYVDAFMQNINWMNATAGWRKQRKCMRLSAADPQPRRRLQNSSRQI